MAARDERGLDEVQGTSIEALRAELQGLNGDENGDAGAAVTAAVEEAIADIGDDGFTFDAGTLKTSLSSLLAAIVAMRSNGANGSALMTHLTADFDTALSPGTVYPKLHDLHDDGVLEQQELVQTKEYRIADAEAARSLIAAAAHQHAAMGLVLRAALEEI